MDTELIVGSVFSMVAAMLADAVAPAASVADMVQVMGEPTGAIEGVNWRVWDVPNSKPFRVQEYVWLGVSLSGSETVVMHSIRASAWGLSLLNDR